MADCPCTWNHRAGGLNRREFLAQSTLAAVAALLASACAVSLPSGPGDPTSGLAGFLIALSAYPSLAVVGGMAAVSGASRPIAVVRTGPSAFIVFSLVCPHQGTTIGFHGGGFQCPNHLATFDASGTWIGGQRTSNMFRLDFSYDSAAGTLTLSGNLA